jgi:hypothetical protein
VIGVMGMSILGPAWSLPLLGVFAFSMLAALGALGLTWLWIWR